MGKLQETLRLDEIFGQDKASVEPLPNVAPKILVVDDQDSVRSLLVDLLSQQNYEVHSAEGSPQAISRLQAVEYDAVIVDIYLGKSQSGLNLLPLVRELQPFTQSIVISGMANTDVVIQALKAGAYDLLCKPFNLAEVLKAVANAVEKKRMSEENARLVHELRSERDNLERRVGEATTNLASKVETLRRLNEQLSTIFEMSQAATVEGPPQKVLEHLIGLLGKVASFEGAFCVVFDLRARSIQLNYADTDAAEAMAACVEAAIGEHHETLTQLMENPGEGDTNARIKQCLTRDFPEKWRRSRFLLMPLYVPQTLLGALGVCALKRPTHLSETEERLLAFAISHFVAALEQRHFLNRTSQLLSLGELVSEIAHDLRHPMTSLRGATRLLHNKWDDAEKRERCLKQIGADMARMESLVAELVNFHHPREMNMVTVDLHEMLDKAVEVSSDLLEKGGIEVVRQFEADPPTILGISRNLIEAFVNLISNALQAMEPGGRLTVATSRELSDDEREELRKTDRRPEEFLRVSFADTGRGIAPEDLNRIFQRFFTTRPEGKGLGLSAVNRTIRKNLGLIRVESEVGRGTTFFLYLPKA